ncbi:hypothetical protein GCM10010245_08540 [Streptomyces spectabilis]|uniref:Bulb-type lectin domain-containing protein n=1 Tax=Streptomyces spectabilis TaxID=68270 RepID=A0A5P2XH09_STRST|nr:hypothetical protein CP982_25985 [Streptomyces spectabilis]GGV03397.1 hypothetical protein GCM10010245_08540 [Streptomyces spectabilis]
MKRSLRALLAGVVATVALGANVVAAGTSSADTWRGSGFDRNCARGNGSWDHLRSGMCLRAGDHISTPIIFGSSGPGGMVATQEGYRADYQPDGNFVISHWKTWIPPEVGGPPNFTKLAKLIMQCAVGGDCGEGDTVVDVLWSSGTSGRSAGAAVMQGDGNFVVYDDDGRPVWNSGTHACRDRYVWARMQQDGNFVLYKGHAAGEGADKWRAVWSTKGGRTGEPC